MLVRSIKLRREFAILLFAFGFLVLQFVLELGIIYAVINNFESAAKYLSSSTKYLVVVHFSITILLISISKRVSKSFYKGDA